MIELRRQFLPPREHYTLIGFNDPAAPTGWHPRLEYVDEAPMNDSPVLMAKAPANVRRMYRLMNLLPGMKRSTRIVRFRF
ncbi:hypothetical protein ABGB18_29165 [Nonomuraea sp. B12E4]|uniref:hypothetical protein n=1 Tax=Nonomuraea sp. B12E4 TaxID=3153564 RepID=UPI00325F2EBF